MEKDRNWAWNNIEQSLENILTYSSFIDNRSGEQEEVADMAMRFIRSAKRIKKQHEQFLETIFIENKVTAEPTTLPQIKTYMSTLSIRKEEKASTAKAVDTWWNSSNVFFSTIAGEEFTNREVILAHLILMALLASSACVENYPIVTVFAMTAGGICVRLLNKVRKKNH